MINKIMTFSASLVFMLILGMFPPTMLCATEISVTVEGQQVSFAEQAPIIVDGHTLVPVRGVFEMLGFDVKWNGYTQRVTLLSPDSLSFVTLTIGSGEFEVVTGSNATTVFLPLDVPAQIINDTTMLPIRSVVESVGYHVEWKEDTMTVLIHSNYAADEIIFNYQILEDFLAQFESVFLPIRQRSIDVRGLFHSDYVHRRIDGTREILWDYTQQGDTSNLVYITYETISGYRDANGYFRLKRVFFNQYGEQITADDVPFIIANDLGDIFLAREFELFDVNSDGVPEVVITFQSRLVRVSILYRFIDGQFSEVQISPNFFLGRYQFFHDDWSSLGTIPIQAPSQEQGLLPAQPLIDLQESISASIRQRLELTPYVSS